MNILIPDEWLRSILKTDATSKQIAEYLSLCGPSVEKIEKVNGNFIYHIEITTNRVDTASVVGIAKEALAILPNFGKKAMLKLYKSKKTYSFTDKVNYLNTSVDPKLCSRFTAVLIKNVVIKKSPKYLVERLELSGVRAINNVVDISNYIMHEYGQPVHTFDFDKIRGARMTLRQSKKGETIKTLDGTSHNLPGGDIVIEDGERRLIDLAGIMGGENSSIDESTKNVLLFVQTYNPVNIRKTSMSLALRTEAVTLFEKGLDSENVSSAILKGVYLFEILTGGRPEKNILDIYPQPYKKVSLSLPYSFIKNKIGVAIEKKGITKYLNPLGFEPKWQKDLLTVSIPSSRISDISIKEDIVEEIARLYGYHNLPSKLMTGTIPDPLTNSPFDLEMKIKLTLKGFGASEVYTSSLVPKSFVSQSALKLKNPLGKETEYLRNSLMPSLIQASKENSGEKRFHLFEIANIYLTKVNNLPLEEMTLAGIFSGYEYREAKGQIEAFLHSLNISYHEKTEDSHGFRPSARLLLTSKKGYIGEFGILEEGYLYYEFSLAKLMDVHEKTKLFTAIPKYPSQVEDITFRLPEKTKAGEVLTTIKSGNKLIYDAKLTDVYQNSYTFRIWYLDTKKTLTNEEVAGIRSKIIKEIKEKYLATV